MITNKQELLQSMIEAYVMEKGTREFYEEASKKASDAEARKAFKQLSEWEHEHMLYIQFLYQSFMDDKETMTFEKFEKTVRPDIVEGGMPIDKMREKFDAGKFVDDLGALTIALEIEGKAYRLYSKLSESVEDTNTKEFMKDMMKLEEKHLAYLKELRYKMRETS